MSKSVGVKVERWTELVGRRNRFIGGVYIEHRRVSELHPTKGWRVVGHTERTRRDPVRHEVRFVRTMPPKKPKLRPLPEGLVAIAALRHVHPRHKRPV